MRDHTKLKAFQLADEAVVEVYRVTGRFPSHEQFGLVSQMRRAAVAVPSNIVEGCARSGEADFLRFLDIAYGSARELEYQVHLAHRLGYVPDSDYESLHAACVEVSKVLSGLIRSMRR